MVKNAKFTTLTILKGRSVHEEDLHCCVTITTVHLHSAKPSPSCKTETLYPLNKTFLFPTHPQYLVATSPCSVSMNMTTLDTIQKQNHTAFVFVSLAYFTSCNVSLCF